MYRILIVGLLTLGGCAARNPQLVPATNYKVDVKVVRAEIMSFYRWLLKTRQLLIIPAQAKLLEEREVDPLTHLPIPKPELSELEKVEKLRELSKKTPLLGKKL